MLLIKLSKIIAVLWLFMCVIELVPGRMPGTCDYSYAIWCRVSFKWWLAVISWHLFLSLWQRMCLLYWHVRVFCPCWRLDFLCESKSYYAVIVDCRLRLLGVCFNLMVYFTAFLSTSLFAFLLIVIQILFMLFACCYLNFICAFSFIALVLLPILCRTHNCSFRFHKK